MKKTIPVLFLIFFIYRIYFWDGTMPELFNMSFNALGDSIVSSISGFLIFNKVNFNLKKRGSLWLEVIKIILILTLGALLLWSYHYTIYTLSGILETKFYNTFWAFSFQIFDLLTVYFVGCSLVFAYAKNKALNENKSKLEQLEKERTETELSFLRSQMNPHFIFNSLNTIQYSINKNDVEARKLIQKFANLFRFHLHEFNHSMIPLEKELEFIRDYIEVMESRRQNTHKVNLKAPLESDGVFIPPLIIIPIVENSFKHAGNHFEKMSLINIMITIQEDILKINVQNSKGDKADEMVVKSGIGLENVKRRLDLQFGANYKMNRIESENSYEMVIEIPISYEVPYN